MSNAVTVIPNIPDDAVVEYITDVEGNWYYFQNIIGRSKVLTTDAEGELVLHERGYLVHGGDACDKGSGDVRIVKALTKLKLRYPDRVFLILGNRDTNKLRFGAEIMREGAAEDVEKLGIGYWDSKLVPYSQWLAKQGEGVKPSATTTLKWVLDCTMGCQTTWESRRTELGIMQGKPREDITDDEVLHCFTESVDPAGADPWLLEYIKCGQFALLLSDTLFVHGGISADTLGTVPDSTVVHTDLRSWCVALAEFHYTELIAYEANPTHFIPPAAGAGGAGERAGGAVMDYCVPNGNAGKTVVYTQMAHHGDDPVQDAVVEDYLAAAGVSRLVVGHQPQGDCPNLHRCVSGLDIFFCDTSYSDMSKANHPTDPDNRGKAIALIWFRNVSTHVEGVLSSGQEHGYSILNLRTRAGKKTPSLIGRHLPDGYVVRTVVESTNVIAYKFEGFKKLVREIALVEWPSVNAVPAHGGDFPAYEDEEGAQNEGAK